MPIYDGCPDPECQAASTRLVSLADTGDETDMIPGEYDNGHQGHSSPNMMFNPYFTGRPRTPVNTAKHVPIDRQEIIRKIKSREGGSRSTSPEGTRIPSSSSIGWAKKGGGASPLQLQSSHMGEQRPPSPRLETDHRTAGLQIERPRSALHRGDFREEGENDTKFGRFKTSVGEDHTSVVSTSPVAPWHAGFPAAAFRQAWVERRRSPSPPPGIPIQRFGRPRAVSNASIANSFAYQAPTSPLVQSSRPDTPEPKQQKSHSPERSRRHTFSPQAFRSFQPALEYPTSARGSGNARLPPTLRKETTFPYQAHQPRRSLHSFNSLPHTPALAARRPSVSESPLHHAPMVGSYEESILRGRMSTTPSKPLNFVAQIGVLGKGNCRANLRCPPHVIVPFPAVFYSYTSGSWAGLTNDQPSPYVGLVDLENSLPNVEPSPEKRRQRLEERLQAVISDEDGSRSTSRTREDGSTSDAQARRRRRQKQKRRSGSPKAPPGGSYRIPQQGQLQIVIKNPNKTAVKLFLVPYDLSDMEPGQKTFIRQRSYSAGPVIDMPLTLRKNLGTDRPEAALTASDDPNDRPMLRYLIHLHICCPAKGRYYLYKSVRVVFANRVPDGKEKLRNEIQLPEPRYSVYKPGRDSNVNSHLHEFTPTAHQRRRSAILSGSPTPQDPSWMHRRHYMAQSLPSTDVMQSGAAVPMDPPSFDFRTAMPTPESRSVSRQLNDKMDYEYGSERSASLRSALSPISSTGDSESFTMPGLAEPFVFERHRSTERDDTSGGGVVQSESLLSKRLKDLAFKGMGRSD